MTEPVKRGVPVATETPDLVAERVQQLQALFPDVMTEGGVDFDKLRTALGDSVNGEPERYSFTWAGKRDAIRLLQIPSRATLLPAPDESVNWDETKHLSIEGDNLEVLKLLYKAYFGRVKMIYIDPPYNTGNDFVYPDKFTDPLDTYLRITGQRDENGNGLTSNPETSGRYHSAWLSMMYPRLFAARRLLRDDGVIFVSIDDHEVYHLRMLMNEIFGEENFVTQLAWQSRRSIQNDTDISVNHEYVVVYAKARRQSDRRLKPGNADTWYTAPGFAAYPLPLSPSKFANPDNDPRGPWKGDPFDAPGIRRNLAYPIINPNTEEERLPPPGRHWRMEEQKYRQLLADGRIVFGKTGTAGPQLKVFYDELREFGQVENTWFDGARAGTVTRGTQEVQELFEGRAIFDFPKPPDLIRLLLRITTKRDDLILDFFAGSCSTAQAVLELNREDDGARRFIMVQLPEPTPEGSTARQQGFGTIADIGKERIRRVAAKLQDEQNGRLDLRGDAAPEDLGFRVFKLNESHYRRWTGLDTRDAEHYAERMELFIDPLLDGWQPEGVIWEVAIKEGYGLTARIEPVPGITTNTVTRVTDPGTGQFFLICLDDALDPATVEALNLSVDDLFICRDVALDDTLMANLALNCRFKTI